MRTATLAVRQIGVVWASLIRDVVDRRCVVQIGVRCFTDGPCELRKRRSALWLGKVVGNKENFFLSLVLSLTSVGITGDRFQTWGGNNRIA